MTSLKCNVWGKIGLKRAQTVQNTINKQFMRASFALVITSDDHSFALVITSDDHEWESLSGFIFVASMF